MLIIEPNLFGTLSKNCATAYPCSKILDKQIAAIGDLSQRHWDGIGIIIITMATVNCAVQINLEPL